MKSEAVFMDRDADGAGQVMPPFAPVDAGAAGGMQPDSRNVDTPGFKKGEPFGRDVGDLPVEHDRAYPH